VVWLGVVKIYMLMNGDKVLKEENTRIFLESVQLLRRGENYIIELGPVEITMPREVARDMLVKISCLLDEEDAKEVLESIVTTFSNIRDVY